MNYVLKEIAVEGDNPKKDKVFQTPSGKEYRVRVSMLGATTLSLVVLKNDETQGLVTSANVALTNNSEDMQAAIEAQLTFAIKAAEEQEASIQEAKNYLQNIWGVDITAKNSNYDIPGITTPTTKIEFLTPVEETAPED